MSAQRSAHAPHVCRMHTAKGDTGAGLCGSIVRSIARHTGGLGHSVHTRGGASALACGTNARRHLCICTCTCKRSCAECIIHAEPSQLLSSSPHWGPQMISPMESSSTISEGGKITAYPYGGPHACDVSNERCYSAPRRMAAMQRRCTASSAPCRAEPGARRSASRENGRVQCSAVQARTATACTCMSTSLQGTTPYGKFACMHACRAVPCQDILH